MDLRSRLADIDARISDAARSAGRDPATITRIVVTKFHPVELVQDLAALGVTDVGENRQQELSAKRADYAGLALRWAGRHTGRMVLAWGRVRCAGPKGWWTR